MSDLLITSSIGKQDSQKYVEACTIVGNCLMVRRDFFLEVSGFSPDWGLGYGEETELQMKAFSKGLKGVACTDTYVYHYGGGTFNNISGLDILRRNNWNMFMSRWGKEYSLLSDKCRSKDPIEIVDRNLKSIENILPSRIHLDFLFYLPCVSQEIGGIHAVVNICNFLIRNGFTACCVVIGPQAEVGLSSFREPVYFTFLIYKSDDEFLLDTKISTSVIISTIFTSSYVCAEYATKTGCVHVQFIQGYEAYFDNGIQYNKAINSLLLGKYILTTSTWLRYMISRHVVPDTPIVQLSLLVDNNIFYHSSVHDAYNRTYSLCVVFRSAPDKGQYLLIEILDRLFVKHPQWKVLIFADRRYEMPDKWPAEFYTLHKLPLDQYSIAALFRSANVFLDASFHEGFGLMPLEASLCGCRVVVSNSGGINDFIEDGRNGRIIKEINNIEAYISAIEQQMEAGPLSKDEASISLSCCASSDRYIECFSKILDTANEQCNCSKFIPVTELAEESSANSSEYNGSETITMETITKGLLSIGNHVYNHIQDYTYSLYRKIFGQH